MRKGIMTSLALLLALTACSNNSNQGNAGNTGNDDVYRNDYTYVYSTDPSTFDYIRTGYATNSDHLANFVDGLLEADNYGRLVGALADPENPYEYNEDTTSITFHLREGVNWYTNEGEVYGEVTADDFVAGLQHAIEFDADAFYMVQNVIVGANDYYNGTIADFSQVGVEAVDKYTVKYTFTEPTPFFHTMTTYGLLYPVNRSFLESKGEGCKLGAPDTANCSFGTTDPTGILYNGAYLLKNYTAKSVIEYKANPEYYDLENVYIENVKLIYSDGSDPDSYFRGFDNGEYSAAPVYTDNEATFKTAQEKYGDSIYASNLNATSFYMGFNLDRNQYSSMSDETAAVSTKTEQQKADTKKAVLNENFRKAIMFAWDRPAMLAQRNGEQLKNNAIRNTITMPEFVQTSDGRSYAQLVAEALAELDPSWEGVDLSDGQDPYYNPEKAQAYAATAKEELAALGVTFPIIMESVSDSSYEKGIRMNQSMASSIESVLGSDFVKFVDVLTDTDNANWSDYYAPYGHNKNMDFSTSVGWGPDYGDPRTYLDILDPDTGAILSNIGLDYTGKEVGDDAAAKEAINYDEFEALLDTANGILDDLDARYEAYAKAEAWLLDNAIMIPYMSQGGNFAVSKVKPYTQPYSFYGLSDAKYKYMQVTDHVVTNEERAAAKAEWEAARAN
ncbi:MAG: peptide ABC transporter substrate-binding protein [Erysipelotrichaceae bacterium]|nr:peptide ABC transporter substrate-binding protein [Erysipelotrichaceae bacterium]